MSSLSSGLGAPALYIDRITLDISQEVAPSSIVLSGPQAGAEQSQNIMQALTANPGLVVTLDLCIKETVEQSSVVNRPSSLFRKLALNAGATTSLKDYIMIGVIQSIDEEITGLLKEADVFKYATFGYDHIIKQLALYKFMSRQKPGVRIEDLPHGLAKKGARTNWRQWARSLKIGKHYQASIAGLMPGDNGIQAEESKVQVTGRGMTPVYSYKFPVKFNEILDKQTSYMLARPEEHARINMANNNQPAFTPQHLTYFVYSYIDIKRLMEDAELVGEVHAPDLTSATSDTNMILDLISLSGQVTTKTLFREGKLNPHSIALFTDGTMRPESIYTGPAHQMDNGAWMTGQSHTSDSKSLIHKNVFDSRIQDRRGSQKFQKFTSQVSLKRSAFDLMRSSFMKKVGIYNNFYKYDFKPNPAYFSDIWLSRDRFDNHMFMFQFDYRSAAKDKCAYPALWNVISGELSDYCKIKRIELSRRRVKEHPEVTRTQRGSEHPHSDGYEFGIQPLTPFDRNNPKEEHVVKLTSDAAAGITTPTGSFARNIIRKVNWQPNTGIRTYSGIDGELKHKGYGNYQYIIEVEIEDGSVKYLQEALRTLKDDRANLQLYYNYSIVKGRYNHATNRFSFDSSGAVLANEHSTRAKEAINNIAARFEVITGKPLGDFFSVNNALELLHNAVDKNSGGPDGILNVLEIVNPIIDIIERAIDVTTTSGISKEAAATLPADGTKRFKVHNQRTFKLSKYFNNDVASPTETMIPAMEYISAEPISSFSGENIAASNAGERRGELTNRSLGTTVINITDFVARTQQEVDRDFKPNASFSIDGTMGEDSPETSRYSFLSPRVIITPGNSPQHVYSVNDFNGNDSISAMSDIMTSRASNVPSSFPQSPTDIIDMPSKDKLSINPEHMNDITLSNSIANFLANEGCSVTILTDRTTRTPWRNAQVARNIETFSATINDFFNTSLGTCFATAKETTPPAPPALILDSPLGNVFDESQLANYIPQVLANIAAPRFFNTRIEMEEDPPRLVDHGGPTFLDGFRARSPIQGLTDMEKQIAPDSSQPRKKKKRFSKRAKGLPNQVKALVLSAQGKSDSVTESANHFQRPAPRSEDATSSSSNIVKSGPASTVTRKQDNLDSVSAVYADSRSLLDVYFKHLNLVKVQILERYTTVNTGRKILGRPNWVDLERRHIDMIAKSGEEFICRAFPYDLPEFGVNFSDKCNMPVFNKYFILKSSGRRKSQITPGNTTDSMIGRNSTIADMTGVHRSIIERGYLRDNLNNAIATLSPTPVNTNIAPRDISRNEQASTAYSPPRPRGMGTGGINYGE